MFKDTSPPKFTAEQLALVKRISTSDNYYSVLGVKNDASITEINKSYKKIAIKLHPDKNHAPGAEEAFKTLLSAIEVLTNVRKRDSYNYDLYCQERERCNRGFQDINHGPSPPRKYTRRFVYSDTESEEDEPEEEKEKKSTFIFLIFAAVAGYLLLQYYYNYSAKPLYSLSPSLKYPIMKQTRMLRVHYYVENKFHYYETHYPELEIEEDYVAILKYQCTYEKSFSQCFLYCVFNILLQLVYLFNAISEITFRLLHLLQM